jgi:protein-L-isoaspartate(D-aspartate) O-methyltransferase
MRCPIVTLLILCALLAACQSAAPTPPPAAPSAAPTADPFAAAREEMVSQQIAARGVSDASVLDAMRRAPRDRFVLPEHMGAAYADHPLPIGHGQTISQPYIVALMSEAIEVGPGQRVLEVGTGSGYQAAILAEMGAEVYTVEIIPALAEQAATRLRELGYVNVSVQQADGYFGWEEHAPYDAIIVTAAPDHMPQPLGAQLKEGGRLVIPIGPQGAVQTLWRFIKRGGELEATNLGEVLFVPLTGTDR